MTVHNSRKKNKISASRTFQFVRMKHNSEARNFKFNNEVFFPIDLKFKRFTLNSKERINRIYIEGYSRFSSYKTRLETYSKLETFKIYNSKSAFVFYFESTFYGRF